MFSRSIFQRFEMAEPTLKQKVRSELTKRGLNYKIKNLRTDGETKSIIFIDANKGTQIHGKIRSFTDGEVNLWPTLKHENLACLIDVLCISEDLYVYLTVDHRITLKEIVHNEAFVYDPGCFDRKRTFARGIFSGLAYLHAQSLCLMNLCDNNIVISGAWDKAVITNFSHLICSQKVSRPKLAVPDVYKAPESEKAEFDAKAAEIWASGVLMLDLFLAHMVPWAVVDYKPKRVVELVDDLSLELLQAANAGSNVTDLELTKFKTFLRCFFNQNPLARLPAKYASIASFLQLKLRPCLKVLSEDAFLCTDIPLQKVKREKNASKSPHFLLRFCNYYYQKHKNQCCLEQPKKDLNMNVKQSCDSPDDGAASAPVETGGRKNSSVQMVSNASTIDRHLVSTLHAGTSINIKKLEKKDSLVHIRPIFYTNKASYAVLEASTTLPKNMKHFQPVKQTGDTNAESNVNSCQSKSLPFVKYNMSDTKNFGLFQFCTNRTTFSFPNIRLPSLNQSNEEDSQSSLCLDRLFGDADSVEDSRYFNTAPGTNSSTKRTTSKLINSPLQMLDDPGTDCERFSRNYASFLLNNVDILQIIDKITFLGKCHDSVRFHQRKFISIAFAQKRRQLLIEYQDLIRKENLRLRGTLSKKYGLKTEDVTHLISFANFRGEQRLGNQYVNSTTDQYQCKLRESRFVEARKTKENAEADFGNVEHSSDTFEDTPAEIEFREVRFVGERKTKDDAEADLGNVKHSPDKLEDTSAECEVREIRSAEARKTKDNAEADLGNVKQSPDRFQNTTVLNSNSPSVGSKYCNKSLEQSANTGKMILGKSLTGNLEKTRKEFNTNISSVGSKSWNEPLEQSVNIQQRRMVVRKFTLRENLTGNVRKTIIAQNITEIVQEEKSTKEVIGKEAKKKKKEVYKKKESSEKAAKNSKTPLPAKHEQRKRNCLCILCPFSVFEPVPSVDG